MIHFLSRLFSPRQPVVVNTFKRRTTDLERARFAKHMQLAKELKRPFPLRPPAFDPNEVVEMERV